MKGIAAACCLILTASAWADEADKAKKVDHWAWRSPARQNPPAVNDHAWGRNPVDDFVLAKIEAAGLAPTASATREGWIRRVTFDLVGLPPTPREIDDFVSDSSEQASANVVDRLLASPHYGERWGRHWLDLARYAESNGYEFDEVRPDAWRYRDYVIAAFNRDKPYDRFVREQLAGDELAADDPDALVATGFNLLGPDMTDASSQKQRRQNTLDDMTDTTGLVFLGLTIGCARCHNHKFEPISIRDFYRLQAFFSAADFPPRSAGGRRAGASRPSAADRRVPRKDPDDTGGARGDRGTLPNEIDGGEAHQTRRCRPHGVPHAGGEANWRPARAGAGHGAAPRGLGERARRRLAGEGSRRAWATPAGVEAVRG